eukprot:TRINITY_DN3265_c0_g1_i6.p1 TRINITY_DN3265_c0_g1~~TRINITY_DN3265_c0_g1_i6.p1  ORF type:complete len:614 (+),score=147.45 TRINITY_DN3265_c0_g1_i6:43-1884(+)
MASRYGTRGSKFAGPLQHYQLSNSQPWSCIRLAFRASQFAAVFTLLMLVVQLIFEPTWISMPGTLSVHQVTKSTSAGLGQLTGVEVVQEEQEQLKVQERVDGRTHQVLMQLDHLDPIQEQQHEVDRHLASMDTAHPQEKGLIAIPDEQNSARASQHVHFTARELESSRGFSNKDEFPIIDPNQQLGQGLIRHCPYESGPISESISLKQLSNVIVHPNYIFIDGKAPHAEPCEGLPCPHFGACSRDRSAISGICHNSMQPDQSSPGVKPLAVFPVNSSIASETEGVYAYAGDMFLLENVYVNHQGEVFNATHHFMMGGCYYLDDFQYTKNKDKVTKFEYLVNLVNWNAINFYHIVAEIVPEFLIASKVLDYYPGIPVAFRVTQDEGIVRQWLKLIGWPLWRLNIQFMQDSDVFYAKKLLTPAHSYCAKPSGSMLEHLRMDVLKIGHIRSTGFASMLRAKIVVEGVGTGQDDVLGETIIVFGRRKVGGARHIVQEEEILQELYLRYHKLRVVSFWGNISVEETRDLFGIARLYIGAHGAGMTNLIFMQPGAAILELRPDNYFNGCYHYLADRCNLRYHAVVGEGDFNSMLSVDVAAVLDMVQLILPVPLPNRKGS